MDDDDLSAGTTTMQRPAAPTTSTSGAASYAPATATPKESTEFFTPEAAGDPVLSPGGESTASSQPNDEISSESTESTESGEFGESAEYTEFAEASPAQLSAESGEESAVSDLRGIEGFFESSGTESAEEAAQAGLSEAGESLTTEGAEFLPFLAALVPTLASAVGPAIAKGIAGKLSPKATAAIKRVPPPRPGAAGVKPGTTGAILAQIAQLLRSLQNRPGGEASMEAMDEAVATEAAAVIEVIIGTDDRVRITNTNQIPWRRICALKGTNGSGRLYSGTGFFISPRAIVTAGHCVYQHANGGWSRQIEVSPGANGTARPYGTVVAKQFRSVSGWVYGKKPENDYGVIILPPGAFGGRNLGHFAFGALTTQELLAKPAVVAGYPGDKPFAELWGMARKLKTVSAKTLVYDIDTMGGQSGSAVYIKRSNGARTVVGIHNYGATSGNSATRITPAVYQRLLAWSKL